MKLKAEWIRKICPMESNHAGCKILVFGVVKWVIALELASVKPMLCIAGRGSREHQCQSFRPVFYRIPERESSQKGLNAC